jgi:hypothetical protein
MINVIAVISKISHHFFNYFIFQLFVHLTPLILFNDIFLSLFKTLYKTDYNYTLLFLKFDAFPDSFY